MNKQDPTFPAKAIAKLLDLSLARVGQLAKAGIITRDSHGRYRITVVTEYIHFLRDSGEREDKQSKDETIRFLYIEKHRKLKLDNDEREGLLISADRVEDAIHKTAKIVLPILDNLTSNIKRRLPGTTAKQTRFIEQDIAKCKNAISQTRVE